MLYHAMLKRPPWSNPSQCFPERSGAPSLLPCAAEHAPRGKLPSHQHGFDPKRKERAFIVERNNLVPGACFLAQPNMLPVTSFQHGFSVYIAISVGLPLPWGLARSSASILPHALRHRHHLHLTSNPCGALLCRAAGISSSSWLRALRHRQFLAGCWTGSG